MLSSGSCNAKVNQGRELAFVAVIPGCSSVYLLQALLNQEDREVHAGGDERGVGRCRRRVFQDLVWLKEKVE